jgi:hypothetical protein
MAPTSAEALTRAPSLRKPKIPKRLVDEALAVVRKRPRGKKPAKAKAVRKARKTVAPTGARSKKKKNTAAEDDDECTETEDPATSTRWRTTRRRSSPPSLVMMTRTRPRIRRGRRCAPPKPWRTVRRGPHPRR